MNRFVFTAFGMIVAGFMGLAVGALATAESSAPFFSEYPVSASPLNVLVQSSGNIWFTSPEQNALGRLVVTSTVNYQVTIYSIPTASSEPYDLKLAAGKIWFTERQGNKIGRFDLNMAAFDEFVIPTNDSQPTGIDVLPTDPVQVWFTESNGNKVARLVVTSTLEYSFAEYPLPVSYPNAQPEDIVAQTTDSIWFTAPNVSRLGNLKPSLWPDSAAFEMVSSGAGSQPWWVTMDAGGYPWITERAGNRVGIFFPQTLSFFSWYPLPVANSDPYGIATTSEYIWFTERNGDRLGRLERVSRKIREFGIESSSAPKGIVADSGGCLWIAESGRNRIASWCPPYFYSIALPMIRR